MNLKWIIALILICGVGLYQALLWRSQDSREALTSTVRGDAGFEDARQLTNALKKISPIQKPIEDTVVSEPTIPAAPVNPGNARVVMSVEEFKDQYGHRWIIRQDSTGRVTKIFGSTIRLEEVNPQTVVATLKSVSGLLGIHPHQVGSIAFTSPDGPTLNKESGTRVFRVPYTFQGYPVLDSQFRVSADLESKAITGIDASEVKPIQGQLADEPRPVETIQKLAEKSSQETLSPMNSGAPAVIVGDDRIPHLVYRFSPSLEKGLTPDSQEYRVDATTGTILAKKPLVIQD